MNTLYDTFTASARGRADVASSMASTTTVASSTTDDSASPPSLGATTLRTTSLPSISHETEVIQYSVEEDEDMDADVSSFDRSSPSSSLDHACSTIAVWKSAQRTQRASETSPPVKHVDSSSKSVHRNDRRADRADRREKDYHKACARRSALKHLRQTRRDVAARRSASFHLSSAQDSDLGECFDWGAAAEKQPERLTIKVPGARSVSWMTMRFRAQTLDAPLPPPSAPSDHTATDDEVEAPSATPSPTDSEPPRLTIKIPPPTSVSWLTQLMAQHTLTDHGRAGKRSVRFASPPPATGSDADDEAPRVARARVSDEAPHVPRARAHRGASDHATVPRKRVETGAPYSRPQSGERLRAMRERLARDEGAEFRRRGKREEESRARRSMRMPY